MAKRKIAGGVIALIFLVVIAGVAWALIGRNVAPVEYHKAQFLAALRGSWSDKYLGANASAQWRTRVDRMRSHQNELIRLGYLEKRVFLLSNCPPNKIHLSLGWLPRENVQFSTVESLGTNRLVVIAVREDMPHYADLVRNADVR